MFYLAGLDWHEFTVSLDNKAETDGLGGFCSIRRMKGLWPPPALLDSFLAFGQIKLSSNERTLEERTKDMKKQK